jgi:RNA polymerase sigma factor (sigma-70 family)
MGDDVARQQQGLVSDRDAFMVHVEGVLDPAYRLATVILLDYTAAEDAVHIATLRAWTRYRRLRGEVTSFRTWFLAIVVSQCRRVRRRRLLTFRRRSIQREGDLRDVLGGLPLGSRAALFCYVSLDLPLDEVARVLRSPLGRVRSRVYRASERVQSELQREEAQT